jgi:lipocalin
MNTLKVLLISFFVLFLSACDHGYEGTYDLRVSSSNPSLDTLTSEINPSQIIIGTSYVETNGERTEASDIFFRESNGIDYLVFITSDKEEAWKIVDSNTLVRRNALMTQTLVRRQ